MEATELYVSVSGDFKPASIWFCGKCRIVHRTEEAAEKCCVPKICTYCNEELPERWGMLVHSHCHEKKMFEQAEKLTEWDGWIQWDGGAGDGFFENVEEFLDTLWDAEEIQNLPEYVHVCKAVPFPGLDVDSGLECAMDDMFEEWDDSTFTEIDELRAFVKAWNKKQTFHAYHVINGKVLLLDRKKIWSEFLTDRKDELEDQPEVKQALIEAINKL